MDRNNPFDEAFAGFTEPEAAAPAPAPKAAPEKPRAPGPLITEPGFYPEISPDEYFAEPCPAPALTNSGIKLLAPAGAAPAKFAHHHPAIGQRSADRKASAAMYRGKLVHRLALDKGDDYAISPFPDYRSAEAREWKGIIEAAGQMPVKQKDFDAAEEMAAIIRGNIEAACQGCDYQTEVVIAWQEQMSQGPVWARAMLDVWCPDLLLALDVKTCADASDDAITRQFANGYATQHCWYRRGLEKLTAEHGRVRFGFLFVESDEPFLSRYASATESFRHGAEQEVKRALAIFSDCMSRGEWPGYEEAHVSPPSWLLHRWTAGDFLEAAA